MKLRAASMFSAAASTGEAVPNARVTTELNDRTQSRSVSGNLSSRVPCQPVWLDKPAQLVIWLQHMCE